MFPLSTRAKEAIKIGLSITIAVGIALWMDWEDAKWAGFGVAMIALSTAGQSLNQGAMRMLGTLVAAVAALAFIAWFPQQRWGFMAVVSLWVGFCSYMMTGKKRQYFWYVSGFVVLVIAVEAGNTLNAFQTVVERTQETGTGILVYSLVSALLWPVSSRGALDDASRKLFATQVRLYRTYRDLMSGKGKPEDSRPLRLQEVQLLSQVGQALNAAETESYEVWEVRHAWQRFQHQSTSLMEALERWRQSFPEIQQLDLTRLLPNLDGLGSEVDLRLAQIARMLTGSAPDRTPQPITLAVDRTELRALTHFQRAAVALTVTQLKRLEALSRSFFDCVRDLRGYGGPAVKPLQGNRRSGLAVDPDRLQGAVTVMATLWIGFLIYVYVNPPGHAGFAKMATIFAMVAVRTGASTTGIALSFSVGTLLGGILYVFVMPHLSGYGQLGLMIFGVTFGISYLFWKPLLLITKSPLLAMFLAAISLQNEQTYSFASFANTLTMMILAGALIVATAYIPRSPRPEKLFLRLLARFFRHAEFVMARLALDWEQSKGLAGRWRMALYRHDLLVLPAKLAGWGERIDYRLLPGTTREQVQALVTSLHALAFRIKEMVEARTYPQADLLVREVIDDVRAWRTLAQEQFRLWTDDPGRELEPDVDVGDRLIARLAGMEARLDETFRLTGDGELRDEDRANFYRLLGSYRGFSEGVIGYARLARGVNWAPWREARF